MNVLIVAVGQVPPYRLPEAVRSATLYGVKYPVDGKQRPFFAVLSYGDCRNVSADLSASAIAHRAVFVLLRQFCPQGAAVMRA